MFIQKSIILDYIFFDKYVFNGLKWYKIIEEGVFFIIFDYLLVLVYFDFKI